MRGAPALTNNTPKLNTAMTLAQIQKIVQQGTPYDQEDDVSKAMKIYKQKRINQRNTQLVNQHAPPKPLFQSAVNPNIGIPSYKLKNDKNVQDIISNWYSSPTSIKKKR